MVGLQAPSSSSSRIRLRPPTTVGAAAASPRRVGTAKIVASSSGFCSNGDGSAPATPAAPPPTPPSPSRGVPLESVVIRSNAGGDRLSSPRRLHGVANNDGGGGNDDSKVKSTSVKVCVRLRPMLGSDFKNADATLSADRGGASAAPPIQSTPKGKGFARETASSHRHAASKAAAQTGLRTPSKKHASGLGPVSPTNSVQKQLQLQKLAAMRPSWTTHPNDACRITQASHTTNHTNHHDPERLADYAFDRVYAPSEDTGRLYDESVRGVVGSVVEGFHGSVFAYGQTNSGKTHTMTGSASEAGVVRLAVQDIFNRIRSQASSSREYLVRVSYLEIYNEQIYDLLALPPTPSKFKSSLQHHHLPPSTSVRIFESRTEGVVVKGLREEIVTCPEDVFALLDGGDAKRKVGSTGMNKASSRSHSVFRLVMESRASQSGGMNSRGIPPLVPSSNSSVNSDTDSVATGRSSITGGQSLAKGPVRISSLSLVDLAGSESVKATGSTGVRQKEGQFINKSLLTLGHVVHKLSDMGARESKGGGSSSSAGSMATKEHIPYRDSKLTRLLQPSLGGNAQVCIICNISPALANLEESHNTLKFAMRAKKIQQHARITEVADEKTLLRSYREEIEELKRQLKEAKGAAEEAQQQPSQQPSQLQQRQQANRTPKAAVPDCSDDEDDQDDTHVLVSAIANLESLILKAGAKSTRKPNDNATGDGDELPSRALDAALMKAESDATNGDDNPSDSSAPDAGAAPNLLASPTKARDGAEDDDRLLVELHRIQGMLGTLKKKKKRGCNAGGAGGGGVAGGTPERDAEVERLRLQLQEQEVTSTMRKADSSFLQNQLNAKDSILKEVSVLLEALERRQIELESENKQLREDLAEAANMIEEGDARRKSLERRLAEKDAQLAERRCIVFVEKSTSTSIASGTVVDAAAYRPPTSSPRPSDDAPIPAATMEMADLSGRSVPFLEI